MPLLQVLLTSKKAILLEGWNKIVLFPEKQKSFSNLKSQKDFQR